MKILQPYKSKNLHLQNRVVMAPMTRSRADNKEQVANEIMVEYYKQRASAGLIISEGLHISQDAIGSINVPGIYTEDQINSWKHVTQAVHEKNGIIFSQLWHVGRISHPDILGGNLPLAPSAINADFKTFTNKGFAKTATPKAMTLKEIERTICNFQEAAINAINAGFDGVELHAANGYLFHQFFAKCSNIRKDEYGGSIENRARFLFDVLDKLREKISLSKVGVRISPSLNNTFGIVTDDETVEIFEYIVSKLNDYDLAYLHISGFSQDNEKNSLETVLETAKHYRELYKGTYIINKGFTRDTANQAIEEGVADLVSFGELFISNPDLVKRFEKNILLNVADKKTYYTQGAKGYIDYPSLKE